MVHTILHVLNAMYVNKPNNNNHDEGIRRNKGEQNYLRNKNWNNDDVFGEEQFFATIKSINQFSK